MNSDATTLGQMVILAGLLITAGTQISLAIINRGKQEVTAAALATKVEATALDVRVATDLRTQVLEALIKREVDEVKTAATKAYHEANSVNQKIADMSRRFDALVPEHLAANEKHDAS